MALPFFEASRPRVGAALRILRLSGLPQSPTELRRRCRGLYQGPDGDCWICDSMQAAERNRAADAYRFLLRRITARAVAKCPPRSASSAAGARTTREEADECGT
jgi:hypothetical protein